MPTISDQKKDSQIGARIANKRIELDISQSTLAKITGISQSQLSRIEAGVRSITLVQAQTLARALDLQVRDLLPGGRT